MTHLERKILNVKLTELQKQKELIEPDDQHNLVIVNAKLELLRELLQEPPSVRNILMKVLKDAGKPMKLAEIRAAIAATGLNPRKVTIRVRLAKMVGSDVKRVGFGTYQLIKK